MRTTRILVRGASAVAGFVGAAAAVAPDSRIGRTARSLADRLARAARYFSSSTPGLLYRLAGRRPDPDVSDETLADRIRSELGPLQRRLDTPRVRVMVDDRIAILHGDVPDERAARMIEKATLRVSGVQGIESHLHPGLARGDTRPSEGRAAGQPRSAALTALLTAARDAGADDDHAAVHAVLCGFTGRIPDDEREQLTVHLPTDVRMLAGPPKLSGERGRVRKVEQLVSMIVEEGGVPPDRAEGITRSVLGALRRLVPEESADIAAVLPPELRELWEKATVH